MEVWPQVTESVGFIVGQAQPGGPMKAGGTAFFVFAGGEIYVVTAKHCIDAIVRKTHNGVAYLRMNENQGGVHDIGIPAESWLFHPTDKSVDVAVIPWSDVKTDKNFTLRGIDERTAADQEVFRERGFMLGDEVFITGLFSKHPGRERNVPIVRIGTLATWDVQTIQTRDFGDMEGRLIEIRSIGGLSGSPVFLPVPPIRYGYLRPPKLGMDDSRIDLYWLGLIHGHWEASGKEMEPLTADAEGEKVNMGIAIVVPAPKVMEVINQERLVKKRPLGLKKREDLPTPDADFGDAADPNKSAKSMLDEIARRTERTPTRPSSPPKGGRAPK